MTYVYHHPQLGPKFIERIYGDLEPTMFRDLRQGVDWLSREIPAVFSLPQNRPGGDSRSAGCRAQSLSSRGKARFGFGLRRARVDEPASQPERRKSFHSLATVARGTDRFSNTNA
jgi:hypothetical protein